MRRELLAAIGVLAVVLVSILAVYALRISEDETNASSGDIDVTAHLEMTLANGSVVRFDNLTLGAGNTSALDLLNAAANAGNFTIKTTYYGQYDSMLVDAIAGLENGQDGCYWQYWINGEYATMGADRQMLHEGDVIEWRFTTFG